MAKQNDGILLSGYRIGTNGMSEFYRLEKETHNMLEIDISGERLCHGCDIRTRLDWIVMGYFF